MSQGRAGLDQGRVTMRATTIAGLLCLAMVQAGPPVFEPVQPDLFAAGGTLTNAWADTDGDGDLDLFVGFNGAPNRLYRNDDGAFNEIAASVGLADALPTRAAAWGDYDGDGDADLLVGFTPAAGSVLRLYRNDRTRFTDVTAGTGLVVDSAAVRQPVWVDFDGDGDLDLFVAFRDRANALFQNDGGRFRDTAAGRGVADARRSVGAVWFDYDEDGDLDLYVGNMDGDANGLFRNQGGAFTDVAAELGLEWGGRSPGDPANGTVRPCAADADGDGHIDLFMANYGPNGLFLNHGGRFEDVSEAWGVAIDSRYDSCAFADYDNDGRLDLFVNGTITGGQAYPDPLFHHEVDDYMQVRSPSLERFDSDHGVQWADFDGDGDLDLALTSAPADASHPLLRNMLDERRAADGVNLMVVDRNGRPMPAGTEIRVRLSQSGLLIATRLVDSGSGYNAQSVMPVHFAVQDGAAIDLEIVLPVGPPRLTTRVRGLETAGLERRLLMVRLE